jgi:acyl-CoA oxidase
MMLNYLKSQGTKEQQQFWLEAARNGDFLAAYAQTELGHGSNVRGIETTATLDTRTREYVVHSPTLTSMKWWPTGMYACTHALVFANLMIDGTNHGFHGFMVQLRGSDGKVMAGVELGEIGPKLNSTSNNIGYCRFTRVRVPMNHLFSKHSSVAIGGSGAKYVAAPRSLSKFRYISMMLARVSIVGVAYEELAKACTIAIRYGPPHGCCTRCCYRSCCVCACG